MSPHTSVKYTEKNLIAQEKNTAFRNPATPNIKITLSKNWFFNRKPITLKQDLLAQTNCIVPTRALPQNMLVKAKL